MAQPTIPAVLSFTIAAAPDCLAAELELRDIEQRLDAAKRHVAALEADRDAKLLAVSCSATLAKYNASPEVRNAEGLFLRARDSFMRSLEQPSGDENDVDFTQTDDYADAQPFEDCADELLERADNMLFNDHNAEASLLVLLAIALNLQAALQLVSAHKGGPAEIEDVCDEVVSQWEHCAADPEFRGLMVKDAAMWRGLFIDRLRGPYEALAAIVAPPQP